jgi:hypothetical protein
MLLMHKTITAFFVADGIIAIGVAGWAILSQVAQTVPPVSNGWQTIALVAVLGLQAYSMYLSSEREKLASKSKDEVIGRVGDVDHKVDGVHSMLNAELTKFKAEAADAYKVALEQGVRIARADVQSQADARINDLESRLKVLETRLENERTKAVTLAAKSDLQHTDIVGAVKIAKNDDLADNKI